MKKQRGLPDRFGDAWDGILEAVRTQKNMRVHLAAAVVVLAAAGFFRLNHLETALLLFAIALVLICEMINTAVEALVDLVINTYHPLARRIKHIAAGAVLLAAITAVVLGLMVFCRPIREIISRFY
ncbi:MAG: diacylglycerol kinase family protein [Bacillota bacterium]